MLPELVALLLLCGWANFENNVLLISCPGAGNGGPCCGIISILQSQHRDHFAAWTTERVQPAQLEVSKMKCRRSPLPCNVQGMLSAHSRG